MAIWSRRVLQRLVLENAAFASFDQRRRWAAAIDRADDHSLDFEWEIVVLHALAQSCEVEYEPDLNGVRPDVRARVHGASAGAAFVTDVATVHEVGREEQNPLRRFRAELVRRARTYDLDPTFLQLDVDGQMTGAPHARAMTLRLPKPAEFPVYFAAHVDPFLRACRGAPGDRQSRHITTETSDLRVSYNPGARLSWTTHPSYTATYSLTRNPVYHALRRKANRLGDTRFAGPLGIILCAADVRLDATGTGGQYGTAAIVREFFRQRRQVAFVLALWTEDASGGNPVPVQHTLYQHPAPAYPVDEMTAGVLAALADRIPPTRNSGLNALNEIRFPRWRRGRSFYGSWSMSETHIKVSARLLVELLAGRLPVDEFLARNGGDHGYMPFFEQKLRSGQLLEDVTVERVPDRDDDWIVFRFGRSDPAGGPMQAGPGGEAG